MKRSKTLKTKLKTVMWDKVGIVRKRKRPEERA